MAGVRGHLKAMWLLPSRLLRFAAAPVGCRIRYHPLFPQSLGGPCWGTTCCLGPWTTFRQL